MQSMRECQSSEQNENNKGQSALKSFLSNIPKRWFWSSRKSRAVLSEDGQAWICPSQSWKTDVFSQAKTLENRLATPFRTLYLDKATSFS